MKKYALLALLVIPMISFAMGQNVWDQLQQEGGAPTAPVATAPLPEDAIQMASYCPPVDLHTGETFVYPPQFHVPTCQEAQQQDCQNERARLDELCRLMVMTENCRRILSGATVKKKDPADKGRIVALQMLKVQLARKASDSLINLIPALFPDAGSSK